MYRRWPSASSVSNARLDFPEPLGPVKTTSFRLGTAISSILRLCSRAPMTCTKSGSFALLIKCFSVHLRFCLHRHPTAGVEIAHRFIRSRRLGFERQADLFGHQTVAFGCGEQHAVGEQV